MAATYRKEKLEKMMQRLQDQKDMMAKEMESTTEDPSQAYLQNYLRGRWAGIDMAMQLLQKEFDL